MQRIRCRNFSEQQGWTIVCELQEEGVSGHKVRAENRDRIQMIKRVDVYRDYHPKWKLNISVEQFLVSLEGGEETKPAGQPKKLIQQLV